MLNQAHWDRVEFLHVAALDALAQRRSMPDDDVIFQGGTCLHLAYGSPRYSEDLDFLTIPSTDLQYLVHSVHQHVVAATLKEFGVAAGLKVSPRNARGHNPSVFELRLSGSHAAEPQTVLKLEFYVVHPQSLRGYESKARVLDSRSLTALKPVVAVADAIELFVDKLQAIGGRAYMKHRDLFDLWWIRAAGLLPEDKELIYSRSDNHRTMYPSELAVDDTLVLTKLAQVNIDTMRRELERFLPPMLTSDRTLRDMLAAATREIRSYHAWCAEAHRNTQNPLPHSHGFGPC